MRRWLLIGVFACTPALSGCAGLAVRAVAASQWPAPGEWLTKADTNHDGLVSRAEFSEARDKLFARLDRNGDGYIDKADASGRLLGHRRSGEKLKALVEKLDRDGDGRVSRVEFQRSLDLLFDLADKNHDGTLDGAEREDMKERAATDV
jgi:Ca2+-binding EF-hand superfamily protein